MQRFSIRRLLAAVTFVAVGFGVFSTVAASHIAVLDHPLIILPIIGSGALIGAGLLHPFRLTWAGAALGSAGMIGILIYAAFTVDI